MLCMKGYSCMYNRGWYTEVRPHALPMANRFSQSQWLLGQSTKKLIQTNDSLITNPCSLYKKKEQLRNKRKKDAVQSFEYLPASLRHFTFPRYWKINISKWLRSICPKTVNRLESKSSKRYEKVRITPWSQ